MASLKLRVPGDNVPVFSIYAPHNGKPYEERFNFYSELSSFLSSASGNGPKAETLAEYVEKVQWAVRPLEPVLADTCLGPELDVDLRDISESEVVKTAARLEIRRAAGRSTRIVASLPLTLASNQASSNCPLSPYLFSMVMTVLITDAKELLKTSGTQLSTKTHANDILYADDTLLIDVDTGNVEKYIHCVRRAGSVYGLSFNWKKLELVSSTDVASITVPTGDEIKSKSKIVYLGCAITSDGTSGSELNRRIGAAREEFETLRRVWSHSGISRARKLEIFNACVVSKVLYSLHSLWLSKAEIRKIDGFQNSKPVFNL
ncbi:unnamed protein product [Prorocentrum cordatum]|uniref:Reverse transcriptase domain-containing protein n=2 Tax=Prorocentrum cordatum TaxID=2364126 RepID=A0ABN9RF01_9DINO|nr:unnamed protein product [Polarella glacialis]